MARLVGRPPGHEQSPQLPNVQELQMQLFAEGQINKGMVTTVEPANLEPSQMKLVKNANVRFDRTLRRSGTIILTPTKPDSHPPLKLAYFKEKSGTPWTVRITPVSAHFLAGGVWTPFTFGAPLTGTVADRFNTADVLDTFIFTNNGADPIQAFDFATSNIAALGNAPKFRYCCGFYNRGVGFALRDSNEVLVGWSGDGNLVQWDATVDETAGNKPLLDSSDDLSDFIKGGFAFTNMMIVLREKSVWHGTKQPIPQDPFYFYGAVPSIGCDCPFSAQIVGIGSLAWADRRTQSIYAYAPGNTPEPIGRPIEKTLFAGVNDVDQVFSAYAPIPNEYTVYIPTVGSNFVQAWTYSFRQKTWTYNEYYALVSANDAELAIAGARIIDLIGTIDSLQGSISSLSPTSAIITARTYGRADGEITLEDENTDIDAAHADFPNGIPFDTQLESKAFRIPKDDIYVAKIVIEYKALRGGQFKLEYATDGGANEDSWIVGKIANPQVLGKSTLLIFRKVIKARRFAWRLTTQAGQFELMSYEVHVYPSGESKR